MSLSTIKYNGLYEIILCVLKKGFWFEKLKLMVCEDARERKREEEAYINCSPWETKRTLEMRSLIQSKQTQIDLKADAKKYKI